MCVKCKMVILAFLILFLSACTKENKEAITESVPVYNRKTINLMLEENLNPYQMDYTENGIFYYVHDSNDESYHFYYQSYLEGEESIPIFTHEGGYVKGLSCVKKKDGLHFAVLWSGDGVYATEYLINGKEYSKVIIESDHAEGEKIPVFVALSNDEYLIGRDKTIYRVHSDGSMEEAFSLEEGFVRKILPVENGRVYVLSEKADHNKNTMYVSEWNLEQGSMVDARNMPFGYDRVSVYQGESLVSCNAEFAYVFQMDETKDEKLIDLKKQSILSSHIQGIYKKDDAIVVASKDPTDDERSIRVFYLSVENDIDHEENQEKTKEDDYAPDGRRIVRLALSKDEHNTWAVEYRVQKYNQYSDIAYVELELYEGTLENYLGCGARPDIILLHDQTEIKPLTEKNALVDILPLFEEYDRALLTGILPKAKAALSVGEGMYALAGKFQMLLCTSDGAECDSRGQCSAFDYLKWYDAFLDQNKVVGMGSLKEFLFADMPSFYDEERKEAFFLSDEFKDLMVKYKEVTRDHPGDLDRSIGSEKGAVLRAIASGPKWCSRLISESQLADPEIKLTGIPSSAGKRVVYMMLEQPMAILSSSECEREAFDFVLYYCRNCNTLGYSGGEVFEVDEQQATQTNAEFWIFEDYLKKEIWETEKPLLYVRNPGSAGFTVVYLSEDHKRMIRELMDQAVGVTKAQEDIYGMLLEEMDGYWNGNKDLNSACDVLQSRVSLYLAE